MKVLLVNEFYNTLVQNLIYYFAKLLGSNFSWTGKDRYRKDFLPFKDLEQKSYIREPQALDLLNHGKYDVVIFSDGTKCLYLTNESNTKRIIIDALDVDFIPKLYLKYSDIYFKCQLPKNEIVVKNLQDKDYNIQRYSSYQELNKVYPLSLTTSYKIGDTTISDPFKNCDVFFNGSGWPQDRLNFIDMIKSCPEINFFGGLFNRNDLNFNCVIPDSLVCKKMNYADHQYAIQSSKICLNIRGNGCNCFRQFEIMHLGSFLLTQSHHCFWGYKEPVDGEHLVVFNDETLVDTIKYYLQNSEERKRIAHNGKKFFEQHYHPQILAQYIINTIDDCL